MPSPPPATDVPLLLRPPLVAALLLALAILHLGVAAGSGLFYDEGYYTLWSTGLSTGYLDHPPMVALMIAAGRAVLGDDVLGVRIGSVLATLLGGFLVWRIGVLLFDRVTGALAAALFGLLPLLGLGFIATPDAPSVLFWTAALSAVAEFMRSGRTSWWLLAGLFTGLSFVSKYTAGFLVLGLLLFLLTAPARRRSLRLPAVWGGALIALVVVAPNLWWNAQHGWASVAFQGSRTELGGFDNAASTLGDFIGGQLLAFGPVLLIAAIAGSTGMFRRDGRAAGLALPVWTSLPAAAYFLFHALHAHVEANWTAPLAPAIALLGAAALIGLARRRPRLGWGFAWAQAAFAALLISAVYTLLLAQPVDFGAADRGNETRGWPAFGADLSALAQANGAHWIATRSAYAYTGEIATALLFAHVGTPVRQIDEPQRWGFLTSPATFDWPALYVHVLTTAGPPQPPTDLFGSVKLVGLPTRQAGKQTTEVWAAFLVSDPKPAFFAGIGQ